MLSVFASFISLLVILGPQIAIQDLSWIAGDWETVTRNARIDEHWTDLSGGSM